MSKSEKIADKLIEGTLIIYAIGALIVLALYIVGKYLEV